MGGKGKQRKTDLKKGVPFKMMFRHHMDPAYYDPKVNDKIFVPDVIDQSALTEEQKKIVESFPSKDRGLYDEKESNIKANAGQVEEDPLEAAVKKMQLRKEHRMQQKEQKQQAKKSKNDRKVKFADEKSDEDEESDVDSADYFDEDEKGENDDDDEYDSEEESEEEIKDGVMIAKQPKEKREDANRVLAKAQYFKPAEGVKFVRYDQYGVPIEPDAETGFDYQKHIATEDLAPGEAMYIEAPPEMVAQMYAKPKPGIQRDVDKDVSKMTQEEREVFNCLEEEERVDAFEGESAGYEELEDDFLMLANEGKPALVQEEDEENSKATQQEEEFTNKNVVIVRDEEAEELKRLREELKKKFGGIIGGTISQQPSILKKPPVKSSGGGMMDLDDDEINGLDEDEYDVEEVDEKEGSQDEELDDDRFQERLDNEYADDQIGDAEGEVEVDENGIITAEALDDAVNEFIESQKIRDRKLYKEFSNNPPELVPIIKKLEVPTQEEIDDPLLKEREAAEILQKQKALIERQVKEDEERGSDFSSSEKEDSDEDDEKKWDCATILSTYTNLDNHPAIVKTLGRVVRTKQRIELHTQFKVPLEGLMAEEISTLTNKKKTVKELVASAKNGPYQVAEQEEDDGSESEKDDSSAAAPEGGDNSEKAMRKKQMKQEKRDKRKLKKELKLAFKTQSTKLVKATTTEIGAIRAGISIKKIY